MATFLISLKLNNQKQIRVNNQIRAKELRVVDSNGQNLGVIDLQTALIKAKEAGLDLIEISPNSNPPIAKIADYGKFLYEQKKKQKKAKQKSQAVEIKSIQIRVGTDNNDLSIKAKKTSEWLEKGHRVKIELFLPGRTRYLDKEFLNERLKRILKLITTNFKVADPIKKSPKGLVTIVEKNNEN